ncbi:alpha-1-acid glycoprotein [Callorhinchus milii]|nr:alpha-1-acid glycoprotein [Callorhinchus milii]|eukprot:gi/632964593/ref/XP_007898473.1/ PREDICTED: uncharacterized protein LOC103183043 [Callorhinchus milii]
MAVSVLLFISVALAGVLSTASQACKLEPVKIDLANPQLAGKWYFIQVATEVELYQARFANIDNSYFISTPDVKLNKTNIKEYSQLGDLCLSTNTDYVVLENGYEFTDGAKNINNFRIIKSKIDNMLIIDYQYQIEKMDYHMLTLFKRNPTASKEEMEIFESYTKCLGLDKDKIKAFPRNKSECKEEKQINSFNATTQAQDFLEEKVLQNRNI